MSDEHKPILSGCCDHKNKPWTSEAAGYWMVDDFYSDGVIDVNFCPYCGKKPFKEADPKPEIKLCQSCKHCLTVGHGILLDEPTYCTKVRNLVSGRACKAEDVRLGAATGYMNGEVSEWSCGPAGEWWEPKE